MSPAEEKRINQFIKSVIESDKRMATQIPGEENHTIIIPVSEVLQHWSSMVKDLEAMKDEQKD